MPDASGLEQLASGGQPLAGGVWSATGVVLSFGGQPVGGATLIPEIEVAKVDQAFSGTPTARGEPVQGTGEAIQVRFPLDGVAPGQYRWQARFRVADPGPVGKWTVFAGAGGGFGVVTRAPVPQGLALSGAGRSPQGMPLVTQQAKPVLDWTVSADPPAALDHLAYLADQQEKAASAPPTGSQTLQPDSRSLAVSDLADGQWYLHLWAVDKTGRAGEPATLAVIVARTPPQVANVIFRAWATNPQYQTVTIRFTVSRPVTVDVTILAQETSVPVRVYHLGHQAAAQAIQSPWDGKDNSGHVVPAGSYAFVVDAVDDAGLSVQARYNGLTITDKVMLVSLTKETLTAQAGSTVFLTTPVTTGGQQLPTPTGTFEILSKEAPFLFHSPYEKGSPYWYPDVTSNRAMLFDQSSAAFVHDAPWRKTFGPGSNGPGIPGSEFTGSHGCVELPTDAMAKLFAWTPLGTPVIVSP